MARPDWHRVDRLSHLQPAADPARRSTHCALPGITRRRFRSRRVV